jgi:Family of unknown function (DUF5317)/Major Facilitator Superfamily
MFLLPSLVVGLALAAALGGRIGRVANVQFRLTWIVVGALATQVVLFSGTVELSDAMAGWVHVGTYVALIAFAAANLHLRSLWLILLGLLANALAIGANGGYMPVSQTAAQAAGIELGNDTNVSASAERLRFLGDVFALPSQLPLANVFSIGDVLIGVGMVAFIVLASLQGGDRPPLQARRVVAPLGDRAFRRLAAGKLVSLSGDWLTIGALVGWVYGETGSTGHVAAILLVRLTPPILGAGVAAFVVDRLPKRGLLIVIEAGRCAAVLGALGGVIAGSRPAVYAAFGLSGAFTALSEALVPSLVPSLVPRSGYAAANALLGMTENAAMVLGSLGAGLAISFVGIEAALAIDAFTFGVAAVLFALVGPLRYATRRSADGTESGAPLAGLRYLFSRRTLFFLVASFAAATMATGLANATLPRFLSEQLGLGAGAYGFGFAALATGLALGKASVGFTRVGSHGGRWIGCALVLMASVFCLLGLTEHAPTALVFLGLIGFVDGTTDVVFDTIVQNEADPRYYGSVFGLSSAVYTATMMAAVGLAPAMNGVLAAPAIIIGVSVFLVAAGGLAFFGIPTRAAAGRGGLRAAEAPSS